MNVLAVGAHYDDIELGCSGTLLKHVQNGDKVVMLVVSDSSYKNPNGEVIRSAEVALKEGLKAADIIGAEMICLKYRTFEITYDDSFAVTILKYIEDLEIDIIYSHWIYDLHRDHHVVAKTVLMAGRHVPKYLMYRSNYYDSEQMFRGNFYSDISDHIDKKVEVIMAHESELKRVRYKWLEFFKKQNANHGLIIGVDYAECFEVVRYLV